MADFKVGDLVRLKPDVEIGRNIKGIYHPEARIQRLLTDIEGGVYLSQPLAHFRYWNEKDLEHADE